MYNDVMISSNKTIVALYFISTDIRRGYEARTLKLLRAKATASMSGVLRDTAGY
jgi:hypothetical protein